MDRARQAALDTAITAAAGFLLHAQSSDGAFRDWDLPPGPSTGWSTAYIAARLHRVPSRLIAGIAPATRRAAAWLHAHQCAGGGWSYNDQVGSDADSSAHAMLLLQQMGASMPPGAVAHLRRFQAGNGGFCTYLPDDGLQHWGTPHVDVSAVCGQVLERMQDTDALNRTREFIASQRTQEGLWNSYWWNTPLYATRHSLCLIGACMAADDLATTRVTLERMATATDFEHALLMECLLLAAKQSPRTVQLISRLTSSQQPDGGWTSAPCLRITRRTCKEPWRDVNPGPLYADRRRLFTSATVLGALCMARAAD